MLQDIKKMLTYIFVAFCLCENIWAATVNPMPDLSTFNRSEFGLEFVPLEVPSFVPISDVEITSTLSPTSTTKPNEEKKEEKKEPYISKVLEDAAYWKDIGMNQLKKVIEISKKSEETAYKRKAKNIIIFVGDGMGLTTITAGRIYKGQYLRTGYGEETMLAFDEFPYTGLAKTYNVDKQVPDSAATATAMFSGIKTHYGAIGMDITRNETNAHQGKLSSIMDWAQAEDKRTGIVTTTRITHATPAASYARIYHRDWECDTKVPNKSIGIHLDIARQLVENAPGKKFNVILGGGLSPMGALNKNEKRRVKFEGSTEEICTRGDNRNLVHEWLQMGDANVTRFFVQTKEQLDKVDLKKTENLLGLFRNNHITYAIAKEKEEPTLKEMTEAAIKVLERGENSKGYVLLVEGGRIDQAHHQNYARAAMHEVLEFDMAVEAALKLTNQSDTLIVVTADHSHSVTLNGYPKRGADILGFANKAKDPVVYETISYANGPGYWDHLLNETREQTSNVWIRLETLTDAERMSPTYRHMATVPVKDESHGGEDVIVFANGPGSSLVRGVFEQNYLAYIMSYAGCMGPAKDFDETCKPAKPVPLVNKDKNSSASLRSFSMLLLFSVLSLLYLN